MLKKTITYTDYNGEERTEDFYFNLTKAELVEMEVEAEGGMNEQLTKAIKSEDSFAILNFFKDTIKRAYGEKSEDGRRFVKDPKKTEEFLQTEAYSEMFIELASDENAAAAFVEGIIPKMDPDPSTSKALNFPKATEGSDK